VDALRWKNPRMPLAYNRNLAAEAGTAARATEIALVRLSWSRFPLPGIVAFSSCLLFLVR